MNSRTKLPLSSPSRPSVRDVTKGDTKAKLFLLMVIACLLYAAGCKKNNSAYNPNYQYNLYPVDSGHYVIYDVDSILYTYSAPVHSNDTVHYQWMEMIGDTIIDNQGRVARKVYCYRRPDSLSQWNLSELRQVLQTTTNLQKTEEDLTFIKLVFPPSLNENWNGNIYIPSTAINDQYSVFAGWNYFYENMDTTYSFAGLTANNAVVVSEVNQVNLVSKTVRTEIYAPNIGKVYENYEILNDNTPYNPGAWDTVAESGFSLYMRAVSYNP